MSEYFQNCNHLIEIYIQCTIQNSQTSKQFCCLLYANQSMAKSPKGMIEVAPRGTTGQTRMNRQVAQPIWKMSSNTCKIPETAGKQPSKEGKLNCDKCGQKGHMQPQ